jgi:thiol-disulfide isomerase/thioredoxin
MVATLFWKKTNVNLRIGIATTHHSGATWFSDDFARNVQVPAQRSERLRRRSSFRSQEIALTPVRERLQGADVTAFTAPEARGDHDDDRNGHDRVWHDRGQYDFGAHDFGAHERNAVASFLSGKGGSADRCVAAYYCNAITSIAAFAKSVTTLRVGLIAAVLATTGPAAAAVLAPWSGGPRVEFTLENIAGGRAQLSEFRHRIVLLHFFATWCEPCRAEMASLQNLFERHAGRPLAIVAVNVAEVKPRVERFFAANPVSFPVILDTGRTVTRAWRVEALPTTIILDAQSTPVLIAEGDVNWGHPDIDAKIKELLAKELLAKSDP